MDSLLLSPFIIHEMYIRAPAFQRLVNAILHLTWLEYTDHDIMKLIYDMKITNKNNINPYFITQDMDLLVKIILWVGQTYYVNPDIYNQIKLIYNTQINISIISPSIKMNSANIRAKELQEINEQFYHLSKKMPFINTNISAKLINVNYYCFNSNSQTVNFTIQTNTPPL
jgi:hypothetical protein